MTELRSAAFLGTGWGFPLGLAVDGSPSMVDHEEDVRQSIRIILGTEPGERVMRPDFGAGLGAFVFEPINAMTMTRIRTLVHDALVDWEARIDVLDVTVTAPRDRDGQLDIEVSYRVRTSNSLHNLVYPFYLDEGTPR